MPGRFEKFVNNYIYHIFNKTINSQTLFTDEDKCAIFLKIARYYRSSQLQISFSHLKRLEREVRESILEKTKLKKYFRVEILAYCIMPTHYHFLLKQKFENGIQKFMADLANSFTKNINIKHEKNGPIFIPRFKSVRIRTEEQLKHVSRYIHLNPYASGLIRDIKDLRQYQWSSCGEYFKPTKKILSNPKEVLDLFGNNSVRYEKFIIDHADYQKSLELIKHVKKFV